VFGEWRAAITFAFFDQGRSEKFIGRVLVPESMK
jgi:hypothetical protein